MQEGLETIVRRTRASPKIVLRFAKTIGRELHSWFMSKSIEKTYGTKIRSSDVIVAFKCSRRMKAVLNEIRLPKWGRVDEADGRETSKSKATKI